MLSLGLKLRFSVVFVVVVGDERLFICCQGGPMTFALYVQLVINQSVAHSTNST